MSSDRVIIRPMDIARDAEGLARMWNESDLAWPGTWSDGVPFTPEIMREWHEEDHLLVVYVAQVGDDIAGYCSFTEGHGRNKGGGYLAVLNVVPRFHGRSIGRRLIQKTIERSVQEGWKRQTLGTWSANFKAVPAYKKTGHFWTPDSSVWMQNFIPGALQLSLAKPFFARHDWYACYVREIRQEWDEQRWEGLKVFGQHWQAEGESLDIWIDREARQPVAVETDRLQIAAIVSDIEPLTVSQVAIKWRLINKGTEPVRVYLHATGDKGLTIDHRDAFEAAPGQTVVRVAQVRIADDAPSKKDDGTAPAVRSVLRIDEDDLELYSGMRPRKPLALDTAPEKITARAGVLQTLNVQLHNERDVETVATVRLMPPPELETDWTEKGVTLPAKGCASLPVAVTASREGVYSLPVRVQPESDEEAKPKPVSESITLFALDPGGMLYQHKGDSARIETEDLWLAVAAKEAKLTVEDKVSQETLLSLRPRLGPPFWPHAFEEKTFSLVVRQEGVRVVAQLSCEAEGHPGLVLHEEIAFSPAGKGRVRLWLENGGSESVEKRLGLAVGGPDRERLVMALPLQQGTVVCPASHYPMGWDDGPRDPKAYREPWYAWEYKGATAAVAWDASAARISLDWRTSIDSAPQTMAPGSRSAVAVYEFYCGRGAWQSARHALLDPSNAKAETEAARGPVRGALKPGMLATTNDVAQARLRIDSTGKRVFCGESTVSAGGGVAVEPATVSVDGLERGRPTEAEVTFTLPSEAPAVYEGNVRTQVPLFDVSEGFSVVRLGTDDPVTVTEGRRDGHAVWTVDNSLCPFEMAPGFGPSVISWQSGGVNQLYSCFPQPGGFSWSYPWFGGIHALLFPAGTWLWEGYLHRERVSVAPVSTKDGQGNMWHGVRASVKPATKKLDDLAVELDFVTVGRSNVIKLIYRIRNLRPTCQKVQYGYTVGPSLGTDPTALTGMAEGVTRRPTVLSGWSVGQSWAAVTNEASGRTLIMVGKQSDVVLEDYGQSGRLLAALDRLRLEGGETHERVHYLVLTDSPAQARGYIRLKDL